MTDDVNQRNILLELPKYLKRPKIVKQNDNYSFYKGSKILKKAM